MDGIALENDKQRTGNQQRRQEEENNQLCAHEFKILNGFVLPSSYVPRATMTTAVTIKLTKARGRSIFQPRRIT